MTEQGRNAFESLIGSMIDDRYAVREALGEGGAAKVFLAQDLKYDRMVAIKVMHPEIGFSVGAERFEREIALAAKLNHPHIVPLLDAGETNGLLFYVMPAISGNTLRHHLRSHRQLPVDEALRLAHDVALAIDYAHSLGVVHRDIKPENILLAGGTAVVTDFGIAKLIGEGSTLDSLTRTGIAVGTVLYMSPEQASTGPIDARSDIYALGCLVYEMLAGEPPFTGPSPQSVMAKHAVDPVPPVRRLRASISQAMDEAIAMAMAKSPGDRFGRAVEFTEALQRARSVSTTSGEAYQSGSTPYLATQATSAQTAAAPAIVPATRAPSRNRIWMVAVAATVVAVSAFGVMRWRAGKAGGVAITDSTALKSIAVLPFDDVSQARDQEYFATGMADELLTALSRVPTLRVAARTSSYALRGTALTTSEIGQRLNVGSVLTGSISREGTQLRVTAQLVDVRTDSVLWQDRFLRDLRDVFAVQEEIAQQIAGSLKLLGVSNRPRLVRAPTSDDEAYQLYLRGRHAWRTRTATSLQQAVSYFQQAIARDSNYASAWAGLADTYTVIGLNFYGRPGENFQAAKRAAQRALALDDQNAEAHAAYASNIAFLDRDWPAADREYQRAIALDASYPTTYYFYAIFLQGLHQFDSALVMANRARDLDRESPVMAQGPGLTLIMAGRFAEARPSLEQAIAVAPNYYFPHAWYGIALARSGMRDSAIAEGRRAVALAPDNVLVETFLGQVYALAGQRDSAVAIATRLEARAARAPVPQVMLARLYSILGDVPRAMAALERGLTLNEAQLAQLRAPGFEALRGNPRYEAILKELRLP